MKSVAVLVCAMALVTSLACAGSKGVARQETELKSDPTIEAIQTSLTAATPVDPTAAAAYGTPIITVAEIATDGRYLTGLAGRTLYVFADDVPGTGTSACTGSCAATWPPFVITYGFTSQTPGLGPIGQFRRTDAGASDQRQVAYRGHPLYFYSGDTQPGDMNGDGVDGRWSVAVP